jgi:solute carrier family 41
MLTLFAVTFPIELGFMATIRALGWVRLPFAFVALSVCFFCIAVRAICGRALARPLTRSAGHGVARARARAHSSTLAAWA